MTKQDDAIEMRERFERAHKLWLDSEPVLDNQWGREAVARDLALAVQEDETGLAPFLILRGMVRNALVGDPRDGYSKWELVTERARVDEELAPLRDLWAALDGKGVGELVAHLRKSLQERAHACGLAPRSEAEAAFLNVLNDDYILAALVRDALYAMRRDDRKAFRWWQFRHGHAGKPCTLAWNRDVLHFAHINSLVDHVARQGANAATLALVGKDTHDAFWVLAIKHEGSVTVLAAPEGRDHRVLGVRQDDFKYAEKMWFPYDLEKGRTTSKTYAVGWDDREPKPVESAPGRLVVADAPGVIGKTGALPPTSLLWLTLLMPMVQHKVADAHPQLPLQYTGEMANLPHAVGKPETALVLAGNIETLRLPRLELADVLDLARVAPAYDYKASGAHRWMVERYVPRLPKALVGALLNITTPAEAAAAQAKLEALAPCPKEEFGGNQRRRMYQRIAPMDPSFVGTQQEVEHERLRTARQNLMVAVQSLAEHEFRAEAGAGRAWLEERLAARREVILDHVARGEWQLLHLGHMGLGAEGKKPRRTNVVRLKLGWSRIEQISETTGHGWGPRSEFPLVLGEWKEFPSKVTSRACIETGKRANLVAEIAIDQVEALEELLGAPREEFPVGLRDWYHEKAYVANTAFYEVDPEDSVLTNPWSEWRLSVRVFLHESAYQARRDKLGLGPHDLPRSGTPSKRDLEAQERAARKPKKDTGDTGRSGE